MLWPCQRRDWVREFFVLASQRPEGGVAATWKTESKAALTAREKRGRSTLGDHMAKKGRDENQESKIKGCFRQWGQENVNPRKDQTQMG